MASDPKAVLHEYLQPVREVMLWNLEGLSECGMRRPLVPTVTNVPGLVQHVTCSEIGYFGSVFGRSFGEPLQSASCGTSARSTAPSAIADRSSDMNLVPASTDRKRTAAAGEWRFRRMWRVDPTLMRPLMTSDGRDQ